MTILEGTARVQVLLGSSPVEGSTVYVYDAAGTYLEISGVSDAAGQVDFELPEGTYKFRADFQSNQYWITEQVIAHQVTDIELNTGGGAFELTVEKAPGEPLENLPVYVFSDTGSYLGMTDSTSSQGKVSFDLADGGYRFRVDYMGYQFWTGVNTVPVMLSDVLTIAHTDVTISVDAFYDAVRDPIEGVPVFVFTGAGVYQGINAATDASGRVIVNLPDQEYKVRADYLGQQFWSDPFTSTDVGVDIAHGYANVQVSDSGEPVSGVNVYLFKDSGAYLGRYRVTDADGKASFFTPGGAYKFRVDYNGSQYWSDVVNLLLNEQTTVPMSLDLLALDLTNDPKPDRFDGIAPEVEPVLLASLFDIQGLMAHAVVANPGSSDKIYYYINDHQGTPQKVVDDNGAVVWEASYHPFGQAAIGIEDRRNDFRFAGQYFDEETGLHYNYFRYYDPKTGRYLTPDPIGLDGGINLYLYASANPINFRDPFGLAAWSIKNQWNARQIQAYSKFMANFISNYSEEIDCADLGLKGLIRFASQNNLPVNLKYWANKRWNFYDAASDAFSSVAQFESTVLMNMGALNIIDNTSAIQPSALQAGDFVMSRWSSTLGHTRIVYSSQHNPRTGNTNVTWYQGNLPPVVPEMRRGNLSEIDPGTLPLSQATRRWNFNSWNP